MDPNEPFPPIVHSLVDRPVDSPEWLEACRVAGPAEIEFALEIVALRKRRLLERQSDIEAELIEIERGYLIDPIGSSGRGEGEDRLSAIGRSRLIAVQTKESNAQAHHPRRLCRGARSSDRCHGQRLTIEAVFGETVAS